MHCASANSTAYVANGNYGQLVNTFSNAIAVGGLYSPTATLICTGIKQILSKG